MNRRDELLGLSEYLAHLAKSLFFAEQAGPPRHRPALWRQRGGAFIATALACGTLVALPGAHPAVMDLASMSRVTKLSIDLLKQKAEANAGLRARPRQSRPDGRNCRDLGSGPAARSAACRPAGEAPVGDMRATLGRGRGGRLKAADLADQVVALATAHG